MTLSFGGGAGVLTIPGLTSDGQPIGGIVVGGNTTTGNPAASLTTPVLLANGNIEVDDTAANINNNTPLLTLYQQFPLPFDATVPALVINRSSPLNGHDNTSPLLEVNDQVGTSGPLQLWSNPSSTVAELGPAGGLGQFGHAAPAAAASITGALSTVTDAAAMDVLTSIIAALVGDGGATDNTT